VQGLSGPITSIGSNDIFPLFGILAFSLMWVHYAIYFLERFVKFELRGAYLPTTRFLVLFTLIMHPGLLAWQRLHQGLGFPPDSLLSYVDNGLQAWVVLGMAAWLSFLAFELHWWYRDRTWFKYVGYATDAGMIAIVFHALGLGGEVQTGWFQFVWYFYAISLVAFITEAYVRPNHQSQEE
jgi:hypothetical protein